MAMLKFITRCQVDFEKLTKGTVEEESILVTKDSITEFLTNKKMMKQLSFLLEKLKNCNKLLHKYKIYCKQTKLQIL
jgi:hypothetical protein